MKIADTFKRTFCDENDETVEHLLFSCKYTELFWNAIILNGSKGFNIK